MRMSVDFSILHRDASFENPMYKTGFMRNHMVAVSATAQQLYIVSILDVHFVSSLPVMQRPACKAWADTRPVQIV
jgi:hypothetical protein